MKIKFTYLLIIAAMLAFTSGVAKAERETSAKASKIHVQCHVEKTYSIVSAKNLCTGNIAITPIKTAAFVMAHPDFTSVGLLSTEVKIRPFSSYQQPKYLNRYNGKILRANRSIHSPPRI